MTWTTVPAPVAGGKIAAAGFGAAVAAAVGELQVDADAATLREWARPGAPVPGMVTDAPVVVPTASGDVAVLAGPASGQRVLRGLQIGCTTAGQVVTLKVGAVTIGALAAPSAGVFLFDLAFPLASGETLTAAASSGTVRVTPTYADRADTAVWRSGLPVGAGALTLVGAGAARTVTQVWAAVPGVSAASVTLTRSGTGLWPTAVPVPARSVLVLDSPVGVPAGGTLTIDGGGTSIAAWAVGY